MAFPEVASRTEVTIAHDDRPWLCGASGTVLGPSGDGRWILRLFPAVRIGSTDHSHMVAHTESLEPKLAPRSPPIGYYTMLTLNGKFLYRFNSNGDVYSVENGETLAGTATFNEVAGTVRVVLKGTQTTFKYVAPGMLLAFLNNLSLFQGKHQLSSSGD